MLGTADAGDPVRLVVESLPGRYATVYLDGIPANMGYAGERVLTWAQDATPSTRAAPHRAAVRRMGERMAGSLGAEFTPAADGTRLTVAVHALDAPRAASDAPGLPTWAAEAVIEGVRAVARSTTLRDLGAGHLDVRWGWWHDVDSSQLGFRVMARQLVNLLGLPRTATRADVWAAAERMNDSVTVATMLDALATIRARHPEAGTFAPGASEADLDALARDLGVPLPESLATVLRHVNGGAFDPAAVPSRAPSTRTRGAPDDASRAWCALLSVDEIRAAYGDLIAVNEVSAAVERWDAHWPVRAYYRPRDGAPVRWPFIPVCRTLEQHELLVVVSSGPWGQGPVLDAFHELGPHDWRRVYDSFAALVDDFVVEAGQLRVRAA